MHTALLHRGVQVSIRTVYRAMEMAGLLHKRRVPHGITKADTEVQKRENLTKQDFHADHLLKKRLTDITEVSCLDGKLYVSPIMDCFNGEIVALEMRENMKKELCVDTLHRYVFGYYNTIRVTSFNPDGLPPVTYREVYLSQCAVA